jgi:hypothetical protein
MDYFTHKCLSTSTTVTVFILELVLQFPVVIKDERGSLPPSTIPKALLP